MQDKNLQPLHGLLKRTDESGRYGKMLESEGRTLVLIAQTSNDLMILEHALLNSYKENKPNAMSSLHFKIHKNYFIIHIENEPQHTFYDIAVTTELESDLTKEFSIIMNSKKLKKLGLMSVVEISCNGKNFNFKKRNEDEIETPQV